MIYFRLVRGGYGSLAEAKEMNVREVIQALHYEQFVNNYESAYLEME